MSRIEDALSQRGLSLPPVATPAGAYVPALQVGDQVMTSGQLPLVDGKLPLTGPVGDAALVEEPVPGRIVPQPIIDIGRIGNGHSPIRYGQSIGFIKERPFVHAARILRLASDTV